MLGYISSTRKKSCHGCVKAKRRCDLGYPYCKRCFVKGIDCKYPNAKPTLRDQNVIIRQSTPDLALAGPPPASCSVACANDAPTAATNASRIANPDPLLFASGSSSDSSDASPEAWPHIDVQVNTSGDWRSDWSQELPQLRLRATAAERICKMLLPEIWAPTYLSDGQVSSVTRGLRALVPEFAFTGSTMFIHQNLYKTHQPEAYQDAVALSALSVTRNASTRNILANSIGRKISSLIAQSSTWTLTEHLAAVQALIVYQCIRLFDGSPDLLTQAEHHNSLLELWSAHLWKRSFNERPESKNDYECWVFHESLRRTVLMSVFVRCGWSVNERDGLADQVPILARLPFTKDLDAWNCEHDEWEMRRPSCITPDEMLIAYGDMAATWTHDRSVQELGPFGKLMLAACRGADDPRLLE